MKKLLMMMMMFLLIGCSNEGVTIEANNLVNQVVDENFLVTESDTTLNVEISDDKKTVVIEEITTIENEEKVIEEVKLKTTSKLLFPFDDTTYLLENEGKKIYMKNEFDPNLLYTYTFNDDIVFEGYEAEAKAILEKAKMPGLGVDALHEKGVTGKGINVAIIDQPLIGKHPEYARNIVKYYDTGCETPSHIGSKHGSAVSSILAGDHLGVAPDANVYFAAAPSWKKDASYFAEGLNWIIDENLKLPKDQKIRVVSVSSAPSSDGNWYINGEDWIEAVARATDNDIMVIDCRSNHSTSFIFSGYYNVNKPNDFSQFKPGYPHLTGLDAYFKKDFILAPASFKTVALELEDGKHQYEYYGNGGESWAVPYVSGVLTLGFQVNPELSWEEMKALLFETAYKTEEGFQVVNPPAFIEAVENTKQ